MQKYAISWKMDTVPSSFIFVYMYKIKSLQNWNGLVTGAT